MRKKIAIILSRFPFPLDKGDKLRAFHQIKYLSQFFDIYLYSIHTEPIDTASLKKIEPYCREIILLKINFFGILKGILYSLIHKYPIQVGYFYSKKIEQHIKESIQSKSIETIYCQLSRTALYAKDFSNKKIFDFQDAFSINYLRISESTKGLKKIFYKREYRTMLHFEQKILSWFDHCTIISKFDKSQITDTKNLIVVIPNGVDTNFYSSIKTEKKYDILFVGNLSYLPNKNAVFYLVNNILPHLLKRDSNIRIRIVGADTPMEIFALANRNIQVDGFVEDIRAVYSSSKVFAAPLFTGAGLQNKILEAMSMQIPCVTTAVVNSSLNAIENKHLLISNNEAEFVLKIQTLLRSQTLRNELSTNAREFVKENYSWEQANEKLKNIL